MNKYIKGKNYVATSFVPKGQAGSHCRNSVKAEIEEEDVTQASEVVANVEEEGSEDTYQLRSLCPTSYRSRS
jgi:zinc protease